jgi:pilus assembly protein CpaB
MSPRQRRGLVTLLLAGVGAVLTFLAILTYTENVAAQLGPRRPVLVLSQDVGAFQAITEDSVTVKQVPIVFAPPTSFATVAEIGGKVSPVSLPAGTFLQAANLMPRPSLGPGQRAVTIAADAEMSVGRTVAVNDVVDVYAAYRVPTGAVPKLEVTGVRVLATKIPDPAKDGILVTVAVTEEQALSLTRARAAAVRILVGRYPADQEVLP